jgi:hypothetical protein
MKYLVLKKWRNFEWRLYPENSICEGQVIYKGHKMGIDSNLLLETIDLKVNNANTFEILNYNEGVLHENRKKVWIKTDKNKLVKTLNDSWNSALEKLESENGKLKKIIITKIFL